MRARIVALSFALALGACASNGAPDLQAVGSGITNAKAVIDDTCVLEPTITAMIGGTGNATAIATQSYAHAFCQLRPAVDLASATWLTATQSSAAQQAGVPAAALAP